MNKISKLLAFVLTLSLVLSCLTISPSVYADELVSEEALALINDLGIYPIDDSIVLTESISRAEFAKLAAGLAYLGNASHITYRDLPYTDVNSTDSYYGSIALLKSMGVMLGTSATEFKPYMPVTAKDALSIMVGVMGYDMYAGEDGNCYVIAQDKGLMKNFKITENDSVSYAAAFTLAYNVMNSDISDYNRIDGEPINNGKETFLEKRHNIFTAQGVVTDDGYTSLYGESKVKSNQIVIDNYKYKYADADKNELLGKRVRAYYCENDEGEIEILCAHILEKVNNVIQIKDKNILDYDNGIYTYILEEYDDDNEYEAEVNTANLLFIYNGKAVTANDTFLSSYFEPAHGYITLIDNDGDEVYDIVSAYSYENFVVGSVNQTSKIIYSDPDVHMPKIELDGKEVIYNITDSKGEDKKLNDIKALNILSVAKSLDGLKFDIKLSSKTIEGAITELGNNKAVINGGEFETNAPVVNGSPLTLNMSIGSTAIFYIDAYGDIAYVKSNSLADEEMLTGYIYGIGIDVRGLNEDLKAKIFTSRGMCRTYDFASKTRVDGRQYKDYTSMLAAVGTVGSVIRFKTNDDMEINWVDTINQDLESESLTQLDIGNARKTYFTRNYSFSGDIGVTNDSLIFQIQNPFDEETATILSRATLKDNTNHNVAAYNIGDKTSLAADIFVCTSTPALFDATDSATKFGVVTRVVSAYDAEEEQVVSRIIVNVNGTEIPLTTEEESDINFNQVVGNVPMTRQVSAGDLIIYTEKGAGKIDDACYQVVYDFDTGVFDSSTGSIASWRHGNRIAADYLYDFKDGLAQTTQIEPSLIGNYSRAELNLKLYGATTPTVLKVNPNSFKVSKITTSDLDTYLNVGTDCSRIFYKAYYSTMQTIIIYDE